MPFHGPETWTQELTTSAGSGSGTGTRYSSSPTSASHDSSAMPCTVASSISSPIAGAASERRRRSPLSGEKSHSSW